MGPDREWSRRTRRAVSLLVIGIVAVSLAAPAPRTVRVIADPAGRPALLRSEPSVRALVVGQVPVGAAVEVLGEARGDVLGLSGNLWLRVRYGAVTGYVYAGLV